LFGDFDYLLVEGLKTIPLPRICIQRDQINQDYFDVSDVVATDGTIEKEQFPDTIKLLDLNDLQQILLWIDNNAKVV
jgi:molybdopterin-guanine dinucleotide biosynthesis protein B